MTPSLWYFCVHFLSLWGLVPISLLIFDQMQANADRYYIAYKVGSIQAKYRPCNRLQFFKSSAHPFALVAWHRHCGYSCIRFLSLWGLLAISLSIFDLTQAYAVDYYITYKAGCRSKSPVTRNLFQLFDSSALPFALLAWRHHFGYSCVHFLSLCGRRPAYLTGICRMQASADGYDVSYTARVIDAWTLFPHNDCHCINPSAHFVCPFILVGNLAWIPSLCEN